jgi:hypothetical protein
MKEMLQETLLVDAAVVQHHLSDLGDARDFVALRVLLQALREEADISPEGLWRTIPRLINTVAKRTLISDLLARHPEVEQVQVEAPLVIVGFPRTGTTLLQNLLACDPSNRPALLWEMRSPVTPPHADPDWVQAQVKETQALLDFVYQAAPEFERIHPMGAESPDECSWLIRNSFASMVYAYTYYIPSYVEWLVSQNHEEMVRHYRYFKLQLQMLLWRRPGTRLVLKDPCHAWHLEALLEVFPDARVIHTHRDVSETLPSLASLCTALHTMESKTRDDARMGRYALRLLETASDAIARARAVIPAACVRDVRYQDLVRDPVGTALGLEAWAGREPGPGAEQAMRAWLLANAQHKKGHHAYTLAQFGLDPDEVQARFAPYTRAYLDAVT